jgi:hypothetical protein
MQDPGNCWRSGSNQLCRAERERFGSVRVDATASERFFVVVEISRAVDFDHDVPVSGVWQQVGPDEIRAERASSIDRERRHGLRWVYRDKPAAEKYVGAPFACCCLSSSGSDHSTACDDYTQVVSQRRHEVLDKQPGTAKPASLANRRQAPFDLAGVTAQRHILSPVAEMRLEHERRLERPHLVEACCVQRARMRNLGIRRPHRRLPLVVVSEQRRGSIQNSHPATLERGDLIQSGLHAVKRRRDVQTHQRHVTARKPPAAALPPAHVLVRPSPGYRVLPLTRARGAYRVGVVEDCQRALILRQLSARRLGRSLVLCLVLALGLLAPSSAGAFTSFGAPFTGAQDLVTGFPSCINPGGGSLTVGPYGGTSDATSLFISDICNGTTYKLPLSGGPVSSATSGATGFDVGVLFDMGSYFGTCSTRVTGCGPGNDGLYSFNGTTLARGSGIGGAIQPRQVTGDPLSTDLYLEVVDGGIDRVQNPGGSPTISSFAGGSDNFDGLGWAPGGSVL